MPDATSFCGWRVYAIRTETVLLLFTGGDSNASQQCASNMKTYTYRIHVQIVVYSVGTASFKCIASVVCNNPIPDDGIAISMDAFPSKMSCLCNAHLFAGAIAVDAFDALLYANQTRMRIL